MNILIPHYWLLEHLDTRAKPQDIQKYLSLCGPSVERTNTIKGEPVYDIEVTTNRVDAMSVRGIAREASTILPEFGLKAKLLPLKSSTTPHTQLQNTSSADPNHQPLNIKIVNNPKLCQRILAIKMSVSKVGPSPNWLSKRLEQVGQRPLNNLIDITNYVMWELGHPIHVFDLDKLVNQKIIVRIAKPGEKLTTLDEKTHTTKGGEVVFDNGAGVIIDLPGIMGTKNTAVTDKTKNILVWVEDIDTKLIRQASMGLAIRTQAAVLNEKDVDPELGPQTITQAINLYQKLALGNIQSKLIDIYPQKPTITSCTLTQKKLDTYLGLNIKPTKVTRILKNLGCQVKTTSQATTINYSITPPSFRAHDLKIPEDYIEEIARIYGYHNLPSTLIDTPIPNVDTNINHHLEHAVKQTLNEWGITEFYTYSLVSKNLATTSGFKLTNHLKLKNPLTKDWIYLRRSLLPSHFQVLKQNKTKGELTIFELANTYHPGPKNELPSQRLELVITTNKNFLVLKGLLDSLLNNLRVGDYQINPQITNKLYHPEFNLKKSGEILTGSNTLGIIGSTKSDLNAIKLNFAKLAGHTHSHPTYIPISPTAPIIEDLTFKLAPKTHVGPVIKALNSAHKLVSKVALTNQYRQNYTFTIHYHHPKSQLTDSKITPIRKKLVAGITHAFKAQLVGKL